MVSTRSLIGVVGDVVLSREPKQRLRLLRTLLAAAVYAVVLSTLQVAAMVGVVDRTALPVLIACAAAGPLTFYALIRSGWNLRRPDPALTFSQMIYSLAALMVGYACAEELRAALLLIVTQIMGFGMFTLKPAEARRLTRFSVVGFASTMGGLALWQPQRFDPRLELLHALMLGAVLLVIGTLSQQFWRLRLRLREQRASLRDALARLETLVRHDAMTGLVNRRSMGELLEAEQRRRREQPGPACLCAIDLDHFKGINDTFGHAAGDAVLQRFATVALASLRKVDVLARWGGEEFLLLLPGTDAAQASALLARLRDALADPAVWREEPRWAVTFSAGLTDWHADEAADAAIERADRAAYQAKARGRNTWCIA